MIKRLQAIKKTANTSAGFTLIELLVVIAILGILATVLISLINPGFQIKRANDSRRKTDIQRISAALELYKADNGSYPTTSGWIESDSAAPWIPALVPGDIKSLPVDPLNTGGTAFSGGYTYDYFSDAYCGMTPGATYILIARLENPNDPDINKNILYGTCSWPAGAYTGLYTITSP